MRILLLLAALVLFAGAPEVQALDPPTDVVVALDNFNYANDFTQTMVLVFIFQEPVSGTEVFVFGRDGEPQAVPGITLSNNMRSPVHDRRYESSRL